MPTWPTAKDPDEVLDYYVDFADRLDPGDGSPADAIDGEAVWTIEDSDNDNLAIDSHTVSGTRAYVRLSGGTLAHGPYNLLCHIETTAGQEMEQSMKLKMKAR